MFKAFFVGDRVRLKSGIFAGAEGTVTEASPMPVFNEDDPWCLWVEAIDFNGSKIHLFVHGDEVEIVKPASKP